MGRKIRLSSPKNKRKIKIIINKMLNKRKKIYFYCLNLRIKIITVYECKNIEKRRNGGCPLFYS